MSRRALAPLLALVLAQGCGSAHKPGEASTLADAEATVRFETRRLDSAIAAAVEKARTDVGAEGFTPTAETRVVESGASPAGLLQHPRVPEVTFVSEPGPDGTPRLGHVLPYRNPCSTERGPQFVYAHAAGGRIRLIVIKPRVEHPTLHVKGACAMPGCGAQPPPPPLSLAWLPVGAPTEVDIEQRVVQETVHRVTCAIVRSILRDRSAPREVGDVG